ncbi:hypothetical protein TA3x_000201 [Tundrisphaera sp. TA3]|uniref:hypothetical protein n=1 Tax=Tundrisphaera sp. TA3 TaxID=3435775 RepID=UPI003EB7D595
MSSLAGYGASGLQVGLDALDKPGRAVRGVLSGKFRELGNLIPFSDTLQITDARDKTSGRDLTDAIGLTSKSSKGWGAWGLGLGAEMLTDPLTYVTGGAKNALTPAGRAVSKSGALRGWSRADILRGFDATHSGLQAAGHGLGDIAHMVDQGRRIASPAAERAAAAAGARIVPGEGLGALMGIGIPGRNPSLLIGRGPMALGMASKLDTFGDKLKYGTAVGRWANGLFDPNVREAVGGATQKAMAQYGAPAVEAAKTAGRDATYKVMAAIDDGLKIGINEEDLLRAARQDAEGVSFRGVTPASQAQASKVGSAVYGAELGQLNDAQRIGLPLNDAGDAFARYAPRQGVDLGAIGATTGRTAFSGADRNLLPMATGANFHRDELWRNIPGGTEMVNDWARKHAGDPGLIGVPGMRREILRDMVNEARASGTAITRPLVRQLGDKADEVAARLSGMSADYSTHKIGLYSPHLAADVARSADQHARTMGSAHAVMGFIGDNARAAGSLPSDAVPVGKLLDDLGMVTRDGLVHGGDHQGAMVEAYRKLAKQGAGRVDPLLRSQLPNLRSAVNAFAIPRDLYDEIIKSHGRWSMPEVAAGPAGLFGDLTKTFKSLVYPIWPASHVRNAVSAGLNNVLRGTNISDHAAQFALMRGTATADQLRKLVPDLPAGLGDDAAREWVRRKQFSTGKVYDGHVGQSDLDSALSAKLQSGVPGRITPAPFGSDRTGAGNFATDATSLIGGGLKAQFGDTLRWLRDPRTAPSPLRMEGTWGSASDFPLLATGRQVGSNIEDFFRGANWLGNRRAGMASDVAGQATRDLHFDYDALTNFEKKVMRNVIPFYTFSRKNLPAQVSNLVRAPGQATAQLRVLNSGRDDKGFIPGYLKSAGAIPTGPEQGGVRQFLSSFGTPIEEAFGRFRFQGGLPDVRGTALQVAGMMNPLIKGPLEQLTDTQLHTGRKLSTIQPGPTATALGRLIGEDHPQFLSQVLANTPAARFLTSLDKLIDDRKGFGVKALSLATGMGLSTVDVAKARQMEAAAARDELLSRMPHVKSRIGYYVKQADVPSLGADEVEMLRLMATMQAQAREGQRQPQRIGVRMP